MTTGVKAGQSHDAGFYGSDEHFAALIVPFVEGGLRAGDAVVLGFDERKNDLVRSLCADPNRIDFVADSGLYNSPASAIAAYRRIFENHLGRGAGRIRAAGDVPHEGVLGRTAGWDRYEWALNSVWSDLPVWSRCLYDTRTVTPQVRDLVERTHPMLVGPDDQVRPNDRFPTDGTFAGAPAAPDPLERQVPAAELVDASPAEVRRLVARVAQEPVPAVLEDLVFGASEAVANALRHGRPPITVRLWSGDGRVVVRVHDSGAGPSDPLVGLQPSAGDAGGAGLGLWITHQLDLDIDLIPGPDGFAVRLRAGEDAPAA
jgi:anti-sigma regulatory factor (Ser/Thr protein kinase)